MPFSKRPYFAELIYSFTNTTHIPQKPSIIIRSNLWSTLLCCLYLSEYSSSYLFEKSRSSSRWGAVNDEDMKNESPARGRISMSSPASVRRTDGRGPPCYKTSIQLEMQILQISMSSPALVRLRDRAFGARAKLLNVYFKVSFQSYMYVDWNDRAHCTFEWERACVRTSFDLPPACSSSPTCSSAWARYGNKRQL